VKGFWKRIGRSGKAVVLLAAGLAGGAAAIAVASVPGSDGQISACVQLATTGTVTAPVSTGPNLRVIDTNQGQTCNPGRATTELPLSWNQQGPVGPQGAAGTPGGQGPQGPAVTISSGHTFTFAGGQVITVGNGNGVTVESAPINLGRSVGRVTFGTGRQALASDIAGLNFATGAHGAGGGGGAGSSAGKVSVHDISITKQVDKASPKLAQFCANGKHIPNVKIEMRKAGKTYLTYTLTNVVISSYQTGGHADQPSESLSLNFTKIEIKY
jgi:hypothetical protein